MSDMNFTCMGSQFRLIADKPTGTAATAARFALERFDERLSRFRPDSELCAFNADPRRVVAASPLLRGCVRAALWAAERTGGLVDPTLVGELEDAGYRRSRSGMPSASLAEALAGAPPRRPAGPHPDARWRQVRVDEGVATSAPPGVRLDSGGSGKGLAADAAARTACGGAERFVVDCGGDLRSAGRRRRRGRGRSSVEHPLTGEVVHDAACCATAASRRRASDVRIWRTPGGGCAHHLLDPATGEPAWTGLIGATALGETALEAETLAKAALLSGPRPHARLLRAHGGVLVHDER